MESVPREDFLPADQAAFDDSRAADPDDGQQRRHHSVGAVDYASQREDAARAVGHLDGVRAVSNEIKLVPPSVASTTLRSAIEGALDRHATREANKVGLCGQAPSDRPEFAGFLASIGIDSISVTPDALPKVIAHLVARR